jgi:hypothetical protein
MTPTPSAAAVPKECQTERESWTCPNMKSVPGDKDMSGDNYACKVCGRTMWLDYEEMR